jgi:hypothetical protein
VRRTFWIAFGLVVAAFILTPPIILLLTPNPGAGEAALSIALPSALIQLILALAGIIFFFAGLIFRSRLPVHWRDAWRGMGLGLAIGIVLGFLSCLAASRQI